MFKLFFAHLGLLLIASQAGASIDSALVAKLFPKGSGGPIEFLRDDNGQPVVLVDLERLRVTQSSVGRAVVQAETLPRLLKLSPQELETKSGSEAREGMIFRDLDGELAVFRLDGHHRSLGMAFYNQVKGSHVRFGVKLIADYSGLLGGSPLTQPEIATDLFVTQGKGYVPHLTDPLEKLQYLLAPEHHSISTVTDCPLRSVISLAIYLLKDSNGDRIFVTDNFVDYHEFLLGQFLSPSGKGCEDPLDANLGGRNPADPAVREEYLKLFFAGDCKIFNRLKGPSISPGKEALALENLKKTKAAFDLMFPADAAACSL